MKNENLDNFIYPGKTVHNTRDKKNIMPPNIVVVKPTPKDNFETYKENKKNTVKIFKKIRDDYNSKFIFRIIYASLTLSVFLIIVAVFSGVFGAANNSSRFIEYDKFIWPVVIQNPEPFNENSLPSNEFILNSSILKAASEKETLSANYDSQGRVLLHANEVETACSALFGDNCKISLRDIDCTNKFYEYNSENNIFYVDAVSYDECFMPNTINIIESDNLIILKVNYITIDTNIKTDNKLSESSVVQKQMEYILKKRTQNKNFYISEVRPTKSRTIQQDQSN